MTTALALLTGEWTGDGQGSYPTIEPFVFREVLTIAPVPGKPFATWRSTTTDAISGEPRHAEVGFLRPTPDGGAELVLAHGFGITEIATAPPPTDHSITFTTTALAGSPSAKQVDQVVRRFRRD